MSIESCKRGEIIIAGGGIAGPAIALRLLSLGHVPRLITLGRSSAEGTEAIPEAAFPLIAELGLDDAVTEAGGRIVEGFENAWISTKPVLRPGRLLHVERRAVATAAVRTAVSSGAPTSVLQ